jgi:hypothetical protein
MRRPNPSLAVRSLLVNHSEIRNLVASSVFSDNLPQGLAPPAIVTFLLSVDAEDVLDGSPVGIDSANFQINSYGSTRDEVYQIAAAVRDVLTGFRGVADKVSIRSIQQSSGIRSLEDRAQAGTDSARPIGAQDFSVTYQSLTEV